MICILIETGFYIRATISMKLSTGWASYNYSLQSSSKITHYSQCELVFHCVVFLMLQVKELLFFIQRKHAWSSSPYAEH